MTMKKRAKNLLWNLYSVSAAIPVVNHIVRGIGVRSRFPVELKLLTGTHHTTNSHKSIVHFSVNKCASQYVKKILSRCAREDGMAHVRMEEYATFVDSPYLTSLSDVEMEQYHCVFKPSGYLYSVFGGMVRNIPVLPDCHVVLMLRDPRDVLTSHYYSVAFSHRLPIRGTHRRGARLKAREHAQSVTVDEFAIDECESVRENYQCYVDQLLDCHPSVYLTKYEDMIGDFPAWLDGLLEYCELEISSRLRRDLLGEAQKSRPTKENTRQHLRQVTPGDHKRKLKPETIRHLNSTLANVLKELKYE